MSARSRRARHKTELRAEILTVARALVQAESYEKLTVCKFAAHLGYSPMTLYSYFADKHALMFTLAQEGFEHLAAWLAAPGAGWAAGRSAPHDDAYVGSGVENHAAFALLLQRVEARLLTGDAFGMATLLWSGMHGVTALLVTFLRFPFGERARCAAAMADTLLPGLGARTKS